MKLIVAGATGFVGTEVLLQALALPKITTVTALARRPTPPLRPQPQHLEAQIRGPRGLQQVPRRREAVIAVTPGKARKYAADEVRRACLDHTMTGLEVFSQLRDPGAAKPFRFIYVSGSNSARDQSKKPWILGEYSLMRGECENKVLEYAKTHQGVMETCVAKPGIIDAPGKTGLLMGALQTVGRSLIGLPKVEVSEIAATLLDQAMKGFEKDTLLNEDLIRIGQKALAEQKGG